MELIFTSRNEKNTCVCLKTILLEYYSWKTQRQSEEIRRLDSSQGIGVIATSTDVIELLIVYYCSQEPKTARWRKLLSIPIGVHELRWQRIFRIRPFLMGVETRNIFWGDYQLFDTNIMCFDASNFSNLSVSIGSWRNILKWRCLHSYNISKKPW